MNAARNISRKFATECRDTYSVNKRIKSLMRVGLTRNQARDVVAGLIHQRQALTRFLSNSA